jgi:hypothetical protein
MAEQIMHEGKGGGDKVSIWSILSGIVWSRFFLYLYDYISLRLPNTRRYRQLMHEHLICRFCGYPIDLLGAWKCECGFSRPGNYYGRCPKCVKHPKFIDCPSCTFTMDVR